MKLMMTYDLLPRISIISIVIGCGIPLVSHFNIC